MNDVNRTLWEDKEIFPHLGSNHRMLRLRTTKTRSSTAELSSNPKKFDSRTVSNIQTPVKALSPGFHTVLPSFFKIYSISMLLNAKVNMYEANRTLWEDKENFLIWGRNTACCNWEQQRLDALPLSYPRTQKKFVSRTVSSIRVPVKVSGFHPVFPFSFLFKILFNYNAINASVNM